MRRATISLLLSVACVLPTAGVATGNPAGYREFHLPAADRSVPATLERFGWADDLRVEVVRRSPIGRHIRGRQYRGGVPIEGTWFALHAWNGRVRRASFRITDLPGTAARDPISETEARVVAGTAAGPAIRIDASRLLVPRSERLKDVWRVHALTSSRVVEMDIDAVDGRVLSVRDHGVHEDVPTATVFDPNPVVALRNPGLRQPGVDVAGIDADLDDARLDAALVELPLPDLDDASFARGRLTGPWVNVQGPAPMVLSGDGFRYTRSDPRFEATMAYAHIDRLQRYLRNLGFTNVNAESQDVYALPLPGVDNSLYAGGSDFIVLGSGGVDDGEDAEVIVHEYGHAIHDDQIPGFGSGSEAGAIGEGWGDFLAASYFARTSSGGFQDACFADWDATSYSNDDPPCLRRLDTDKVAPEDLEDEVHSDGEIWSGFLWDLRASLGSTRAEKSDNSLRLVIASHELLNPDATFADGIEALKVAARRLGRTDWVPLIQAAGQARGLAP